MKFIQGQVLQIGLQGKVCILVGFFDVDFGFGGKR
jgi:hypothetical protein